MQRRMLRMVLGLFSVIWLIITSQSQAMSFENSSSTTPKLIGFVSLTMPKQTLVLFLQEAKRYHIPVAIRGVIDHSLKATMQQIYRLVKKDHIQGVLIDPIWFRDFQIQHVPALVATTGFCDTQPCLKNSYDVIYGNARLEELLQAISRHGTVGKPIAKAALNERYHG